MQYSKETEKQELIKPYLGSPNNTAVTKGVSVLTENVACLFQFCREPLFEDVLIALQIISQEKEEAYENFLSNVENSGRNFNLPDRASSIKSSMANIKILITGHLDET